MLDRSGDRALGSWLSGRFRPCRSGVLDAIDQVEPAHRDPCETPVHGAPQPSASADRPTSLLPSRSPIRTHLSVIGSSPARASRRPGCGWNGASFRPESQVPASRSRRRSATVISGISERGSQRGSRSRSPDGASAREASKTGLPSCPRHVDREVQCVPGSGRRRSGTRGPSA